MTGFLQTAGLILSAVVLIEAVALSGITKLGVGARAAWLSPENVFLLLSDYVLGVLLVWLLITDTSSLATCFVLGAVGLTHLFRCVPRVIGMPRPFCATTAMVLLNMAKLVVGAVLWGVCLAIT